MQTDRTISEIASMELLCAGTDHASGISTFIGRADAEAAPRSGSRSPTIVHVGSIRSTQALLDRAVTPTPAGLTPVLSAPRRAVLRRNLAAVGRGCKLRQYSPFFVRLPVPSRQVPMGASVTLDRDHACNQVLGPLLEVRRRAWTFRAAHSPSGSAIRVGSTA
jgi:hypothetical protein